MFYSGTCGTVIQIFTKGETQMKLKHLFYLNSVLLILAAPAFLITPGSMLGSYHITNAESGVLELARNSGGLFLFIGLAAWFAARSEDSSLRRNIRLSFFIMNLVMAVAHYVGFLLSGGSLNGVIVHGILTLAYGYFQFIMPEA
jgi:hypothetical protein